MRLRYRIAFYEAEQSEHYIASLLQTVIDHVADFRFAQAVVKYAGFCVVARYGSDVVNVKACIKRGAVARIIFGFVYIQIVNTIAIICYSYKVPLIERSCCITEWITAAE